jgi:23S rRNA pseudouridine2605 synthase
VNSETVRELGPRPTAKDAIKVDGRRIKTDVTHRYIVLYKPRGYVTTRKDPEGRRTVMDLIGEGDYIYPVGRLDYDSEGLLLMMTDGDLAGRLMHPRHEVDKARSDRSRHPDAAPSRSCGRASHRRRTASPRSCVETR